MTKRIVTKNFSSAKIAHFLLVPELFGSPPNEALIAAYHELGYSVDIYAPGHPGFGVGSRQVEYTRRWLVGNAWQPKWRQYSSFSGTSEDPLGVVGLLSLLHRRPAIALVDEIKSGSYYGDRSESWKRLCRVGMRRARLTIVNDVERIQLQREYASLPPTHPVVVYPGGYRETPAPVDRSSQRRIWGMREDALILGASGAFNLTLGADWLIQALERNADLHAVIQPLGIDALVRFLLGRLAVNDRVFVQEGRLDWQEAWAQASALDIGMVVYKNSAPQFQAMGTSSNRLCMFLAMGVPVIASRQESFRFLEEYECGVLVDDSVGLTHAIKQVRCRLPQMKANALRCWRDYVATPRRYQELVAALGATLG